MRALKSATVVAALIAGLPVALVAAEQGAGQPTAAPAADGKALFTSLLQGVLA
jgi:hypothetical protein